MKRLFDVIISVLALAILAVPMLIVALLVKLTSRGPVLYCSDRVGLHNKIIRMPKFRTMSIATPQVATHLLTDSERWLTPVGPFLRKTSLDELPQLWTILSGDMSLVGPRPALFNQEDLIRMRTERGVHRLVPGLTGWAQINGRDELMNSEKVEFDAHYLQHKSFLFDVRILLATLAQILRSDGVVQVHGTSASTLPTEMKRAA